MGLINQTIASLHGGMSGQNIELRRDDQVEDMINALPTLAQGLRRRNPTTKLTDADPHVDNQWMYSYDRGLTGDATEQYIITIASGTNELKVMDTDGVFKTVTYDGTSQDYLLPNSGSRDFTAITIKDTTIIVNKTKDIESLALTPDDSWKSKAYVWVQRVDYNYPVTTTLSLDGTTVTATYPTNTSSTEVSAVAISDAVNAISGYTATVIGSIVEIVKDDGSELFFTYSDTIGDSAGRGWCKNVQLISDLPLDMKYENVTVRVENSGGTDKDDYYLTFEDGVWLETFNPETPSGYNPSTMPHELVRNVDGTFTLREREWSIRSRGDDITSEDPSFVGETIRDLFFMKDRLGFITSTTISMSESGGYGNFYRTTTLSLLDSDPIDFNVDSTQAINLEYCAFLQNSLIVFSDKQQFKIDGGDILSPRSVQATAVTAYDTDMHCRPIAINSKVFFCATGSRNGSLIEYVKDTVTSNVDGQNISIQVPDLIPNKIRTIVASSTENMVFLLPEPIYVDGIRQSNDTIYCYRYYYEGNKLLQSSWFKWKINGDIYSMAMLGNKLMLMNRRRPYGNTEVWDDDTYWDDSTNWSENVYYDTIETIELDPIPVTDDFRDNITADGDDTEAQRFRTEIVLSEWMLSIQGKKEIHGVQDFRTIEINSGSNSDFTLVIENTNRNKRRELLNKYVVGRKPYIGGKAKDVKISIVSDEETGFEIGSLAYEGNFRARGKTIR